MSSSKKVAQPALTGAGEQVRTRLITVLDTLKSLGSPTRLEDLQILLNIDDLHPGTQLYELFETHERVLYDPKTSLWSWKPEFELKTTADVHRVLRANHIKGGMQYKILRESAPNVQGLIEELEQEGKVYVQRSAATINREGQLKVVYWNEYSQAQPVEQEFKDEWKSIVSPNEDELESALKSAGLTAASTDGAVEKSTSKVQNDFKVKKKKKGPAQRKHRITNTHLAAGSLKDFSDAK